MPHRTTISLLLAAALTCSACSNTKQATQDGHTPAAKDAAPETSSPQNTASQADANTPSPERSSTYASTEVTFPSEGVSLKGTLTLPPGTSADAPAPAIVLVHGSGPQTRDQNIPGQLGMSFPQPVPVFADIAHSMTLKGYAVLRYDKRTCGPFNNCADNGYPTPPEDITERQFVEDANAAFDFLAARPDIRAERIIYVGHSQGGSLGLEALTTHPWAGAVLLAANFSPLDVMIRKQRDTLKERLLQANTPEGVVEAQMKQFDKLIEELDTLRDGEGDQKAAVGGASPDFWRTSFALAEERREHIAQMERPVALIFGGMDWNVPDSEATLWREAIASADQQDVFTVLTLPGITHALNRIEATRLTEITPDTIGDHVALSVMQALLDQLEAIPAYTPDAQH